MGYNKAEPGTVTATKNRVKRAATEALVVDSEAYAAPHAYKVYSGSGKTYTVNLKSIECSCPDCQDGYACKHLRRVAIELGLNPVEVPENEEPEDVSISRIDGSARPFEEYMRLAGTPL